MPSAINVAILATRSPTTRPGGVEIFIRQLAGALGGARVYAPSMDPTDGPSLLGHFGLEQPSRALAASRAFRDSQRRGPCDVVISNGLAGWPLAFAAADAPMIQVYHFTFAGFAQKALRMRGDRFTTGRVEGFFDRLAGVGKTVAAVSESVAREVSTFYGHTASVLPNGVDVIRFRRHSPDDAREQLDLPRDARIGLFVGRAEYAKGFDFVLEIARKMPDVNIVSVSQPIPGPSGLLFRADIPHERMALLYSAADFFLLPSRYEGFNLSLLEALACELPAVTSSAAYPFGEESPDLATVVDPLTSEGLVKAIRQTMDRGPQRNLRERIVREYSLDAFSDRWTRLVRSVLAGG